jgi:hypothetical protein
MIVKTKLLSGLFVAGCAAFLCGCSPPYTFSPYVGAQQNWSVGTGGYVKVIDGATIYPAGAYPARHYTILGAISTDNENNLAKAVRDQHADAAIISQEVTTHSGDVAVAGPGVIWNVPLRHSVVTANLIRYTN